MPLPSNSVLLSDSLDMEVSLWKKIGQWVSLVKFQHTIFALPFAMIGYTLAVTQPEYSFSWILLLQILGCMVFARNTAMGFNRWADRKIDAANPRTASREIPSGKISPSRAMIFVVVNALLFIATAYTINMLCFYLSFAALALLLGYSYTKRFTALCHIVLGLTLAIAPTAAYISVTGSFDAAPLILSVIVLLWCSGFDILYSVSDEQFDKSHGIHSMPMLLGVKGAFILSAALHALVLPLLVVFYYVADMGWIYIIGASIFAFLLIFQHTIVTPKDFKHLNAAFFTSNGVASIVFALGAILDKIYIV